MANELNKNSIIRRSESIEFARLHDEMFAMNETAGFCYALNEAGGRVWELIQRPISVGAICKSLQQEFAVDETQCLDDVLAFLGNLRQAGFLEEMGHD